MGFNEVFIGWIRACVSFVTFEVLVKVGKSTQFRPSKGLRQGDPLSSYVFIIGQEVLSRLIEKDFVDRNIDGVKESIRAPPITHVMYAEDIVLFSKSSTSNAKAIMNCINKYYDWSGQNLNTYKFGVFFSKHTPQLSRRAVKHILHMKS